MALTEIAQLIEIVRQHVTIARRHAIVAYDISDGHNYVVNFSLIVTAPCQLCPEDHPIRGGPVPDGTGLHPAQRFPDCTMFQIVPHALEDVSTPVIAPEVAALIVPTVPIPIASRRGRWGRRRNILCLKTATAPHNVERVSFRATLRVFYTYDCYAALSRIAYQRLSSAPVNTLKTKVGRARRQNAALASSRSPP